MYNLNQLLESPSTLPSIPRVIALTLNELNQAEPDLMRLRTLISQDPILTSRLLQLVNSAAFNLTRSISTVNEALAVLGLGQVKEIVLTAALVVSFNQVRGVPMRQFWRYSLNVAKLSRRLARYREAGPSPFTAGLLSAIGELVMQKGLRYTLDPVNARADIFAVDRAAVEVEMLGYSYAQAGGGFARTWQLGEELAHIIEVHDGIALDALPHPLAGVLKLASWRCRAIETNLELPQLRDTFPHFAAYSLGMDFKAVLDSDLPEWTSNSEVDAFTR